MTTPPGPGGSTAGTWAHPDARVSGLMERWPGLWPYGESDGGGYDGSWSDWGEALLSSDNGQSRDLLVIHRRKGNLYTPELRHLQAKSRSSAPWRMAIFRTSDTYLPIPPPHDQGNPNTHYRVFEQRALGSATIGPEAGSNAGGTLEQIAFGLWDGVDRGDGVWESSAQRMVRGTEAVSYSSAFSEWGAFPPYDRPIWVPGPPAAPAAFDVLRFSAMKGPGRRGWVRR